MSQVPSSDGRDGRCASGDSSKDPASPTAPDIPVGPTVAQRGGGEAGAGEGSAQPPMSNGRVARYRTAHPVRVGGGEKCDDLLCLFKSADQEDENTERPNGVQHGEDAALQDRRLLNGAAEAEC